MIRRSQISKNIKINSGMFPLASETLIPNKSNMPSGVSTLMKDQQLRHTIWLMPRENLLNIPHRKNFMSKKFNNPVLKRKITINGNSLDECNVEINQSDEWISGGIIDTRYSVLAFHKKALLHKINEYELKVPNTQLGDEKSMTITVDSNESLDGVIKSDYIESEECEIDPSCTKTISDSSSEELLADIPAIEAMPAAKLNITFKITHTETRLLKRILLSHGLKECNDSQNFNLLWTGGQMKPDILHSLSPYQRVNHFPRSYELTRKDRLYKNIENLQHLHGFKHFDIVPLSFMLPLERKALLHAHRSGQRDPWIVKPAASSRGRGIFIVNSPDKIPVDQHAIVSRYISDPLCIDGHKCDVRLYVAVTSFEPLVIYLYEEGLVRLATVKYTRNIDQLWNACMHLCNYSINKYHSDYIKSKGQEDVGHKWTFSALLRQLKSQGCNVEQLMLNIEDVIIKCLLACTQSIVTACRMFVPNGANCFELYGFDILIDSNLKPWLIEANLSPSLGVDSPVDTKVKTALMVDLLTLIGIPAYSPETRNHFDTKWSRFNNTLSNKRTNSVDNVVNNNKKNGIQLSAQEQRIVKNVRSQYNRRRGFVRIFPVADSLQKYGSFLHPITGIPISNTNSAMHISMINPHNFNIMLHNQLYGLKSDDVIKFQSSINQRMEQYERQLDSNIIINFTRKPNGSKCITEARNLRNQMSKLIEDGNEMSQLQARRTFSKYLTLVLERLAQQPKQQHEKLILKFISRSNAAMRTPDFLKLSCSSRTLHKDRGAVVARTLSDFIELYNRETETFIDNFDLYGMIPTKVFNAFLEQSEEADLEAILTLHINCTQQMSFLCSRQSSLIGSPPPIPIGLHGFLRALPNMYCTGSSKELNEIDTYYKNL